MSRIKRLRNVGCGISNVARMIFWLPGRFGEGLPFLALAIAGLIGDMRRLLTGADEE